MNHNILRLKQNKILRIYDLEFTPLENNNYETGYELADSMIINKVHQFTGNSIEFESRFKINKYDFVLSGAYNLPLEIGSKS